MGSHLAPVGHSEGAPALSAWPWAAVGTSGAIHARAAMKFSLPADAFPELVLSLDEQKALIDEANKVLDETIACNERFLATGKTFRRSEWKPVRSKEGIHVFKQRHTAAMQANKARATSNGSQGTEPESDSWSTPIEASASSGHSLSAPSARTQAQSVDSYVETLKRPHVPLLALSGTLNGTLEDTLYGCFADTDELWRWRSTHVDEHFDDARILAKVLRPTPTEPFRFLGVKWFIKEHPAVLSSFVKRRDFLILEATGITKDSRGDLVGYLLMHSVAVPRIPELTSLGVTRANTSFCFLIRPNTETTVDLFCRGFSDPQGEMIERVSVLLAAESLIAAVSVVDYAYVKKLKWLMGKHQQRLNDTSTDADSEATANTGHCGSCQRSLHKFGILSGSGSACHICRKIVCNRCNVVKKFAVDVTTEGVTHKSLKFCLMCVLKAKETPAWDLASATLQPKQRKTSSTARQRMQRAGSALSTTPTVRSEKLIRIPRTTSEPFHPTPTGGALEYTKVTSRRGSEVPTTAAERPMHYVL